MRMRYHALLDTAGGAPQAQQTILYDLGWCSRVVDAGQMSTDPPGLGQMRAAEMRGLIQRLDAEQILRNPWGNLGAWNRTRLLLWKSRLETAVVRDGEVIELCAVKPIGRQAEPLHYAGADISWALIEAEAVQRCSGADVPRIPLWPRRPRLVEPRPTGAVRPRRLLRRCR